MSALRRAATDDLSQPAAGHAGAAYPGADSAPRGAYSAPSSPTPPPRRVRPAAAVPLARANSSTATLAFYPAPPPRVHSNIPMVTNTAPRTSSLLDSSLRRKSTVHPDIALPVELAHNHELTKHEILIPPTPEPRSAYRRSRTFVQPTAGPIGRKRKFYRSLIWTMKIIFALLATLAIFGAASYQIYKMHVAAVLANGPVYANTTACRVPAGESRLLPPDGPPFLGMSIDWAVDTPSKLQARLGFQPACVGTFIKLKSDSYESDMLFWNAQLMRDQARAIGNSPSMLQVILMPNTTLESIQPALFTKIAQDLRRVNYDYGVPVLLRFAHEMNGNWNFYGQRPLQYKRTWIELTNAIRNATNLTATMWAPNMGQGYPYTSNWQTPTSGPEFQALDTNKDGRLNLLDDPYTPYYPGDEYVDWIGLSVYWFGYRQGENALPIGNHFEALIHGTSEWSIQGGQPVWDFYAMFPNKPFGIPETGVAFYVNSPPGPGELAMKRAWWNMTLTSKPWTRMQRLQMIGWFEEDKTEERGAVSYAVSFNSTIKTAFLDGLPEMREGGDLAYSCDGTIGLASAAAQTSEGPTGPVRNGRSGR